MLSELQQRLTAVQESVPLAQFTTFRIGGPAKYFYTAEDSEDVVKAARAAVALKIPYFILGAGSNVLISDKGFDGLVIKIHNSSFMIHNSSVVAGAGVPNAVLARAAVNAGLTGIEWIVGVPGTIGGAVRGNAGAYGGEMRNVVSNVKVINTVNCELMTVNYSNLQCKFEYRDSIFKHNQNLIILEVEMKLQKGDKAEGEKKLKQILKKRGISQPKGLSSGCVFKNVKCKIKNEKFRKLIPAEFIEKGIIPTGWIIDQLGLKGKQIGNAQISPEHGNFIINTGQATAEDVVMLISIIKQKTRDNFGVQLQEEIQLVGF